MKMTLEQALDTLPSDVYLVIDESIKTEEGFHYNEIFRGQKIDFVSHNFKNYKIDTFFALPYSAEAILYLVIKNEGDV